MAFLPEILLWLIVVQCCALAVLPLALRLFTRLPDGGYVFAKPLGLLLVTYLVWLPAMLGYLEYRRSTVAFILALLTAGCWLGWGASALEWLRQHRRMVGLQELMFVVAGVLAIYVRAYNPDILGQEKFMDMAFFNGFLASTDLPAEDPWLSGYGMPYYPFGYLLLSLPAKLSGLPPEYGYNLALVLVFALTVLLAASLVANLVNLLRGRSSAGRKTPDGRDWAFGVLGALFVAVCGNLVGPLELLAARGFGSPAFWTQLGVKDLTAATTPAGWLPSNPSWWWHASRVIPTIQPDGITEFPYFSFLLGDLHPHFTAIPLLMLIAALALALLLEGRARMEPEVFAITALALGAPIVANTWDVATFWSLYVLAALAVARRTVMRDGQVLWRALAWSLGPLPLSVILFSPYFVGYASQPLGLALVVDQTPLVSLLIIFGPYLLLCAALVLRLKGWPPAASPGSLFCVCLALSLIGALAWIGHFSAALALALLSLVLAAGVPRFRAWLMTDSGPAQVGALYVLGLTGLALGIILAAELVYIRDSFGTRMNTVFKFYYHVWLLLGLVGAPALALWSRSALATPRRRTQALAAAGLAVVLLPGLVYPLAATWTKSDGFQGPATLDGSAFLQRSRPADAAAIRWLARRPDRSVVLEAVGGDYEEFARVSTFSGLPTVLGWVGHELQWRGQLEEYNRRQQDIDTIYQRAGAQEGLPILDRYRVRYVFFGSLERERYGRRSEERLEGWLTPVFRSEGATVFAAPG